MKRHFLILLSLSILVQTGTSRSQTYAWRYLGGSNDGYALGSTPPTDLNGNSQLAKFAGGSYDGYALLNTNPIDLANNDQLAKFAGGSYDGYAMLFTNPVDLANNNQLAKFTGGSYDGYAMLYTNPVDLANNDQLAKFAGGSYDGYAMLYTNPVDLANNDQLAKFGGGSYDGYAMLYTNPVDLANNDQLAKFGGGSYDGYAMLFTNPVDLANNDQLAKFGGGSYDGYAMAASSPTDFAGNSQLVKFQGGSYDGYAMDSYAPPEGNVPAVYASAFLQGAYSSGVMTTYLNSGSHLPLSQPYNVSPWYYQGMESVLSIPSSSIVDWVLLEIRTGTSSGTLVEQKAAFLKSDGAIVDTDGVSEVTFPHTSAGDYYLVLRHRNHLSIMSAAAIYFGALNAPVIDFRYSQLAAYGTNPMKDLTGGNYGLFSGDGSANGAITVSDRNSVWRPQNGTSGYKSGDYNLTGNVTISDRNSYWRPNNGISTQVP
jgi:hypothetical protein